MENHSQESVKQHRELPSLHRGDKAATGSSVWASPSIWHREAAASLLRGCRSISLPAQSRVPLVGCGAGIQGKLLHPTPVEVPCGRML